MTKRAALGNGINSLFSSDVGRHANKVPAPVVEKALSDNQHEDVKKVSVTKLTPNLHQPRQQFKKEPLKELSQSIKAIGILQPILVKKLKNSDKYMIISGERRWRAAQMAGLHEVPVINYDFNNQELLEATLIENIQRQDLNIIEEAEAYKTLSDKFSLSQEEISKKVGKERTTVANIMRILKLSKEFQRDLIEEIISTGHARTLLSLDSIEDQMKIRNIIVEKDLSVRQTEKLVRDLKKGITERDTKKDKLNDFNPNLQYIADNLQKHFGTKVRIMNQGKKGKVEISYTSFDDLERILNLINQSS